jgi:sterol desaturase/sphingolipid hydroxylase (fatty acid hydroxylase superfamily)
MRSKQGNAWVCSRWNTASRLYGTAVLLLAAYLLAAGPHEQRLALLAWVAAGLGSWSAIEYGLHRFVLHGLQPFRRWHAEHHQRPTALICAPTILSATLIVGLVFLPALVLGNLWQACALTLGVLVGYLAYSVTHHATHHWRADNAWLKQRKQWHALHHHHPQAGYYGVTSSFWDRVCNSAGRAVAP